MPSISSDFSSKVFSRVPPDSRLAHLSNSTELLLNWSENGTKVPNSVGFDLPAEQSRSRDSVARGSGIVTNIAVPVQWLGAMNFDVAGLKSVKILRYRTLFSIDEY
jgi:hypothetical protein